MPERIFVAPAHVVIQSVQKRVGDGVTKAAFDLGLVARQWPEVEGEEFIRDAVDPVLAAALVLGDGADAVQWFRFERRRCSNSPRQGSTPVAFPRGFRDVRQSSPASTRSVPVRS